MQGQAPATCAQLSPVAHMNRHGFIILLISVIRQSVSQSVTGLTALTLPLQWRKDMVLNSKQERTAANAGGQLSACLF